MIQKPYSKRPLIFSIFCLVIVLLIGSITLLEQTQQPRAGKAIQQMQQATSGSIVGAPTLTAATVDKIFAQMGSPMVGTGSLVEQTSRQTNIDDAFALGVWWTETNDGAAGVGRADRNPGSVRGSYGYPSAYDGYTIYPSYAAAIVDWFNILKSRYVSRGLTSVYSLCYSYVGTSSAPFWATKVVNLMYRYQGIAPPPPTPALTPTATAQQAATTLPATLAPVAIRARQLARITRLPDNMISPGSLNATTPMHAQQPSLQSNYQPTHATPLAALPLVCIGLLTALTIALAGLCIGHKKNETGEGTSPTVIGQLASSFVQTAPITETLSGERQFIASKSNAVHYTSYAPHAPITETLTPFFAQGESVPQLDFPAFPAAYQSVVQQQLSPVAAWGTSQHTSQTTGSTEAGEAAHTLHPADVSEQFDLPERATAPMAEVMSNGSLLKGHRTTEALGKNTRLRLRLIPESAGGSLSGTNEAVQERVPIEVAQRRQGGLLQRYAQR